VFDILCEFEVKRSLDGGVDDMWTEEWVVKRYFVMNHTNFQQADVHFPV